MDRKVVVIAPQFDPHADAVVEELRSFPVTVFRIDVSRAFFDFDVSFTVNESVSWRITDQASGKVLSSLDESISVWWRRTHGPTATQPDVSNLQLDVKEVELNLKSILQSLPANRFPLGHPTFLGSARNKILQSNVAAIVGFRQPRTLFANNLDELSDFATKRQELAVKSLEQSAYLATDSELSFVTNRIPSVEFLERLTYVRHGAVLLQDAIRRNHDLRVAVFPNAIHAVAIDTTRLPDDEIDWRPKIERCEHKSISLDEINIAKCREFLTHLNIPSGHFDFICHEDGELVFLECNPNGQWLWLELMTGQTIAKSVAAALAQC